MNKSSFWAKFKRRQVLKVGKYDDSNDLTKTSKTSTDLSTALPATKHCKYAEGMHEKDFKYHSSRDRIPLGQSKHKGKVILDIKYMEEMVCQVKELKRQMHHFEMYYIHNICNEFVPIGDFDKAQSTKLKENDIISRFIGNYNPVGGHKSFNHLKKPLDQRSIFTNNKIQNKSKNEKNKSNASIVLSMFSSNKPKLIKIGKGSNDFQTAADEFIQQAEELKHKIGYILNCTGYTIASSSELSIKSNISNCSTVDCCTLPACDNKMVKSIVDTLSAQYKEILKILLEVTTRLDDLSAAAVTASKNNTKSTTSIKQDLPDKNASKSKQFAFNRHNSRSSGTSEIPFDQPLEKNLEPVVMVYEPIQPDCSHIHKCKACRYCGRELGPCVDTCKGVTVPVNKSSSTMKPSEKNEQMGFLVTYTPDFASESTSCEDKDSKKKHKKKKACLWF